MSVSGPRWRAPSVAVGIGAVVIACQGLIGIEELQERPRPDPGVGGSGGGASGSGGDPGTGGSGVGTAGSNSSSGSGGSGGSEMPGANGGGAPDAGNGSEIVVSGRVIDFFQRPVPDVPVTIGGSTGVTNDAGEFTISGVQPPYTASLMVSTVRNGAPARYGYVYEGLTRDSPTLQVYRALPDRSATSLTVAYQDIIFEDDLHYVMLAWSSPDGELAIEESTGPTEYLGVPSWTGPATTTGTIHALDAYKDTPDDPPVAYQAYQTFPLSVSDNQDAAAGFSLPYDPNISTGAISGTLTGGVFDPRTNYVSVRFSDGTAMPLIDEIADAEAFSYFVPNLPGASLIVAGADGTSGFPPYAVAHREIPTLANDVALALPRPVTLSSPQVDAPVTPSTRFAWSPLSQTATTFLFHLEFVATFQGIFVLTTRTQIELPEFPDGFTVPAGVDVTWAVETHGDAPDVDALTGPNGYLDAFSLGTTHPVGPSRSDGYYTESERRLFTMGSD
jgi:hypothetical protein